METNSFLIFYFAKDEGLDTAKMIVELFALSLATGCEIGAYSLRLGFLCTLFAIFF